MLQSPNLQNNRYPEIIPIEEERTIQETISRKSVQTSLKIRYRLSEVTNLEHFMTSEVQSSQNKNTILYIIPASPRNFANDFFDTSNSEGAMFYYLNSNGNHSPFFENYFVLSSPFIAIFQSGEKITEIPLVRRQGQEIEFEKICWIVNNSVQNIIEHGLRKGINLISTIIRSNADSGGSSNADSLDFGKGLRLGSNQVLKDSSKKRLNKKYDSLQIDSEEEKQPAGGEVLESNHGFVMQQRLSRGFSFMPSSINSSIQGSGKDINIKQKNSRGSVIIESIGRQRQGKMTLGARYLQLLDLFFTQNGINEDQFLLYSLYVGLKKCSVGRLGRLANSSSKEILKHFKQIEKNGRLKEFLIKYLQKIKFSKLFPLLNRLGATFSSKKPLMKNRKELLKKLEKYFKRKIKLENLM